MTDHYPNSDIDYDEPFQLPEAEIERRVRIDWHVRMIRQLEVDQAAELVPFKAEIERLQSEMTRLREVQQRKIDRHKAAVEEYHRALHRDLGDDAPRTINLPYGVLSLTVPQTHKIEFTAGGKPEALEWVRENHPDHLKVDVNITAMRSIGFIKDTVNGLRVVDPHTGEVVPGVEAVLPEPTWNLKTTGEAPA